MAKVIVERPRGGRWRKARPKGYQRYLQRESVALPIRECMLGLWNGGTKYFSEHLGPLQRFLESQVGRPWNKVHSEICRHIRRDSVVQNHVFTHLWGYVERHVVLRDGVPYSTHSYRAGRRISVGSLYVCPKSGLLKKVKPSRRQTILRRVSISDALQYHLADGIWNEVRLRKLPPDFEHCWDAFLKRPIGKMHRAELWQTYGMVAVYALSARPLSRQEAKRVIRK